MLCKQLKIPATTLSVYLSSLYVSEIGLHTVEECPFVNARTCELEMFPCNKQLQAI